MSLETNRVVARAATERGTLVLDETVLIGTFLTPKGAFALIREDDGAIRQIEVGDHVSTGQVVAIHDGQVMVRSELLAMAMTLPLAS